MLAHERPGIEVAFEDHGAELGVIPHLRVSLDAYFCLVDELVVRVAHTRFRPNQIVAITFGGTVPGRALSQALHIPLAYLGAESYAPASSTDHRRMRAGDEIVFARDLITTQPGFGTKVLLVDDLADSGRTFYDSIRHLQKDSTHGSGIREIQTAALWHKAHSSFDPKIAVDRVTPLTLPNVKTKRMPWIDQPLEWLYAIPELADIERRVRERNPATTT